MDRTPKLAKLTRPSAARLLLRQRLVQQLLPQPDTKAVAYIHAPAGSGKTSLAATFAERLQVPCLWYQVDAGDNDLASVFYHLRIAATSAFAGEARHLPLLTPEYALGIEAFSRSFLRQLFALTGAHFLLVFDDCHAVTRESAFIELLRWAIEELPPHVQLLMLSRLSPSAAFARIRAKSELVEIDAAALSLSEEEAAAMAQHLDRADLSKSDLARVIARVGAWITGFMLALRSKPSSAVSMSDGCQPGQLLFDYFAVEAFGNRPVLEQKLLLELAVLPWMSERSAAALTGLPQTLPLLETLATEQHFTSLRSGSPKVFVFHPLFRDFLLAQGVERLPESELRTLRGRAAELLEREGADADAFALYAQAQAWAPAVDVLLRAAQSLIAEGRHSTVRNWIGQIPVDRVEHDARLLRWLAAAWLTQDPDLAQTHYWRAYRLAMRGRDKALMARCWSGTVDAVFLGHRDLSRLDGLFEEFDRCVADCLGELPLPDRGRIVASAFLALVFRRPNHPRIAAWTGQLRLMSHLIPDKLVRRLLSLQLTMSHLWRGDVRSAHAVVKRSGPPTRDLDADPFVALTVALSQATYFLHSGEHEVCVARVEQGLEISSRTGLRLWDATLCGNGAAACLGAGDAIHARRLATRMAEVLDEVRLVEYSQLQGLEAWLALTEGASHVALDRIDLALDAATRCGVPYFRGICLLMAADINVDCQRFDEARAFVERVAEAVAATGNNMLTWFACLMRARVAVATGDAAAALPELREGLRIGREHGYQHFYYWPRETLSALFAVALENDIEVDYVHTLILHNKMSPPRAAPAPANWPWAVRVFTLGRWRVEVDGAPLTFVGKVQKTPLKLLKALIAFGGSDVSEQTVIDALWPDADGDAARQTLATTLSRLRKLVGGNAIIRQDARLSINAEFVWSDIAALRALHLLQERDERRVLRDIKDLYRGRFLVDDDDAHWATPMRERIHKLTIATLVQVARKALVAERHDDAISACEQGIDLDETAEPLYVSALQAFAAVGRTSDAVKLYRQCQQVLATHLGTVPSHETQTAYQAVLARTASE